jgi:glycerol-3-phosphate dehydrogenase
MDDTDVAVVGAGVVGAASALALARRGASVVVLEAEPEPGLAASGTNSGILHTGFDSRPGELETELILRSAALRDPVLEALGLPVVRCGALLRPLREEQRGAAAELRVNAERNGVEARLRDEDGALEVPGESVTDPVRYTLALAAAAAEHGAQVRTGARVAAVARVGESLVLQDSGGGRVSCRVVVNCAGLHADDVARLAGDDSFSIYPRKGEFLVFEPPPGQPLERILLPVPSKRTKGMLVFPSVDGHAIAGPTAVDGEDADDWTVRPGARDEILRSVTPLWPAIEGAEQVAAYAGLRPAGRGVNYLIRRSAACGALVNVAAIRSTGLTASLGIAERVCALVEEAGVGLGPGQPLRPGAPPESATPWWRRTAEHRAA